MALQGRDLTRGRKSGGPVHFDGAALEDRRIKLVDAWAQLHLERPAIKERILENGWSLDEYPALYVRPLVDLLLGYLESGDQAWADVYLDELTRILPDQRSTADDLSATAVVLAAEEEIAESLLAGGSGQSEAVRRALTNLHRPLTEAPIGPQQSLLMVGDCLMTEIRAFLAGWARRSRVPLEIRHRYMGAGQGVGLAPAGELLTSLSDSPPDFVALSFLTFEGSPFYQGLLAEARRLQAAELDDRVTGLVATIRAYVEALREGSDATFLLHGVCGLPMDRVRTRVPLFNPLGRGRQRTVDLINQQLRELADHTVNTVFVDEAAITTGQLREAAARTFPRKLTDGSLFHTTRLGALVAERYATVLTAHRVLAKTKVLAVDLDNTLWKGVMAEGRVEHDADGQRLLRRLREAGILLVVVSKNDPATIRWEEMALRPEDFVLHKVGWGQKVTSLEEAASQLDLDLGSFVLLDDNPVERELVSNQLPQVATLDPTDSGTWEALSYLFEFPNTTQTEEARVRTEMYREAAERREAMSSKLDYPSMMASLSLRVKFGHPRRADHERIAELLQRTNQFNTTTRRRSLPDIVALAEADDTAIYVASLSDKFGALGLVGVVITARDGPDLVFDSVVMSCRAMGFGLEQLMLRGVLDAQQPWERAVGLFVTTARNGPSAGLFADAGFESDGEGRWVLTPANDGPSAPAWIDVVPI